MATTQSVKKPRRGGRPARNELRAPGIPYTMKLPDGRTVFVEVPARMASRDRGGDVAFTPRGVLFLDRVRALASEAGAAPSPAYLAALREGLGLTQAQLGRLIGRDKLTISRWECGTLHPNAEALEKVYALARKMKHTGVVLTG
jgi:DNA-binding XRE family transcriptional regulator